MCGEVLGARPSEKFRRSRFGRVLSFSLQPGYQKEVRGMDTLFKNRFLIKMPFEGDKASK